MLLDSRVDMNFVISSFSSIFYAFYLNIFFNLYISIYMLFINGNFEKILIYKFPFYSRSEKILIFFIILYMII